MQSPKNRYKPVNSSDILDNNDSCERGSFVDEALKTIVNKMFLLGFSDDVVRNRSEGSKVVGLQYYHKREPDSPWEAYTTYNPINNMLSLHYHKFKDTDDGTPERERSYPAFFIQILNDHDAQTVCKILDMKSDYLWSKSHPVNTAPEEIRAMLRSMGCAFQKKENNISKWTYGSKTILIENGVKLSIYMFDNVDTSNSKPIMAIRNIQKDGEWEEVLKYMKHKIFKP